MCLNVLNVPVEAVQDLQDTSKETEGIKKKKYQMCQNDVTHSTSTSTGYLNATKATLPNDSLKVE